jgi:hypothetical protein
VIFSPGWEVASAADEGAPRADVAAMLAELACTPAMCSMPCDAARVPARVVTAARSEMARMMYGAPGRARGRLRCVSVSWTSRWWQCHRGGVGEAPAASNCGHGIGIDGKEANQEAKGERGMPRGFAFSP